MKTCHTLLALMVALLCVPAFATDWNTCRQLGLTTIDDCMRYDDDPAFRADVTSSRAHPKEDSKSATPPQTIVITGCDSGGCWDQQGNQYSQVAGNIFEGPSGRCRQIGMMMQCP
jgi:hypothetical protein